jgi:phage-related minor tail protein
MRRWISAVLTAQEMVAKAEAAFKKADEIWNLRKGDHYVNDEARARFWNDRETARLALDMAQQQAGVAKANEENASREAAAESDRQKYAAQAQANYAKTQSALEKYTARQNELNKALKDGRILQADYNINLAAAKSMRILSRNRRKGPQRSEHPPAPGRPIPPPHRRWSLRRSYVHCKSTRVSMTLSASSGRNSGDSRPASPFWKRPQKTHPLCGRKIPAGQ